MSTKWRLTALEKVRTLDPSVNTPEVQGQNMRKCVAPDVKIHVKNTQGDLETAYKSNVMARQQQCHIEGVFGHPGPRRDQPSTWGASWALTSLPGGPYTFTTSTFISAIVANNLSTSSILEPMVFTRGPFFRCILRAPSSRRVGGPYRHGQLGRNDLLRGQCAGRWVSPADKHWLEKFSDEGRGW